MSLLKCPLCGATTFEAFFSAERVPTRHIRHVDELSRPGDFGALDIVGCNTCGHVFNRAFDTTAVADLYQVHPSTNAPVHDSMVRGLRDIGDMILGHRKVRPRVLEIGCGVGALAKLLAERVEHIDLIEPNLSTAATSLDHPRITLLPGFFPAASTGKQYDIIICRQVLEHIDNPVPFLAAIREHLAPAGEAYIEVPSMDYVVQNGSPADLHYLHVQYFTKAVIQQLFARVGFEIRNSWTIKNGHDFGFLLAAALPHSEEPNPLPSWFANLQSRLNNRRTTARVEVFEGTFACYGACAYSQALFGMYPDMPPAVAMFDDTDAYARHAAYHQAWNAPVEKPRIDLLRGLQSVVITSYLHDQAIAARLAAANFTGKIYTLRTDRSDDPKALAGLFG